MINVPFNQMYSIIFWRLIRESSLHWKTSVEGRKKRINLNYNFLSLWCHTMTPTTIKSYKPLEICFPVFTFVFVASKSVQNFQLKLSTCEINFSAQSKLNTKVPQNKVLWKTFALIEKKNAHSTIFKNITFQETFACSGERQQNGINDSFFCFDPCQWQAHS